jgi:AAA-like domain
MNSKAGTFFQEGGSLDATFPSYMERKADQELFEAIQQSRFCYILTARQMGKSSLCIRAKEKLGKEGFLSSYVDITSYGKESITADKWYRSVLETISYDLGLQKDVYDWWKENDHLTSVFRFFSFIKKEISKKVDQSIVIFVDEN